MHKFVCVNDFHDAAKSALSRAVYDYIRSGAYDEITVEDNVAAFKRLRVRPRPLQRSVAPPRRQRTSLLGSDVASPIGIAPSAMHALAHHRAEAATAEAAGRAGVCYIQSTFSSVSLEEVAKAQDEHHGSEAPALRWFQLYVTRDRSVTHGLIRRAEAAGFKALVITIDAPVCPAHWADMRNGFDIPTGMQLGNFDETTTEDGQATLDYTTTMLDPSLTWADIKEIVHYTKLPVIAKGVLTGEDTKFASESGVKAVIVSNHGGRQLDGVVAAVDALPEVCREARRLGLEVYMDGGVRTGTDVLKALALGARAVFIGRPVLWGLACDGTDGVASVLRILINELDVAMALTGARSLEDISSELISSGDIMNAHL